MPYRIKSIDKAIAKAIIERSYKIGELFSEMRLEADKIENADERSRLIRFIGTVLVNMSTEIHWPICRTFPDLDEDEAQMEAAREEDRSSNE